MPRLVSYRDRSQQLNLRARSYLQANCAHCHRKWGGGNAEFQMLATLELGDMGIVNVRPNQGTFNIPNAKVLAPGDPYRSVMFYRMSTLGPGHMPRLGSNVIDETGVRLIHDWIKQLPATGQVSDANSRASARLAAEVNFLRGESAPGAGFLKEHIDPFLASPTMALRLTPALAEESFSDQVRTAIVAKAMTSEQPEVRDLFERFLPEEKRVKRLGAIVKPEEILAIKGDLDRGRKLFFEAQGIQCRNCHRIGGQGQEVGPDLDGIGKKYDRAAILDNILFPSKQIDQKYLTWRVETKRGQFYSGLLVNKDATKVVLKDANAKLIEVKTDDIENMATEQKSLMPELLLRDMTAEQVADLTAYLSSLKQAP
jgi:putative heme-binding domain-containing protein